ncbi:hypothetical protein D3C84_770750 [compost metagenome]
MNEIIFELIYVAQRNTIEHTNIELCSMSKASFNPVSVTRVVAPACMQAIPLTLVSAEEAIVSFAPIEGHIIPRVEVNHTGVVLGLIITLTQYPVYLHVATQAILRKQRSASQIKIKTKIEINSTLSRDYTFNPYFSLRCKTTL